MNGLTRQAGLSPAFRPTFFGCCGEGRGEGEVTVFTSRTGHAEVDFTFGPAAGNQIIEATFPGNIGLPATFVHYALARVPGQPTRFVGLIQDNAVQPIGRAHVELEVAGARYQTYSDAQGRFAFSDIASGAGHLHVDGAPATTLGTNNIPTNSFPSLQYSILVVPNAENSLPTPVLLPRLNTNNARWYYGTNDLVLTCEGIEGLKMTIRAHSMKHPNGEIVSEGRPALVSLNQVHHDNIPMPMPDGASPPFAWTLQPGGATFFPPVEVEYPNMSGLAPGAAAFFLTFNHDTERFEIVASGHVVEDGSKIMCDPGAGLTISGWGCNCPPYSVTGDSSDSCENDPRLKQQIAELKAQESAALDEARRFLAEAQTLLQQMMLPTGLPPFLDFGGRVALFEGLWVTFSRSFAAIRPTFTFTRGVCVAAAVEANPFFGELCVVLSGALAGEIGLTIASGAGMVGVGFTLLEDLQNSVRIGEITANVQLATEKAGEAASKAAQIATLCAALSASDATSQAIAEMELRKADLISKANEAQQKIQALVSKVTEILDKAEVLKQTIDGWWAEIQEFLRNGNRDKPPNFAPQLLPGGNIETITILLPDGQTRDLQLTNSTPPPPGWTNRVVLDLSLLATGQSSIVAASNSFIQLAGIAEQLENLRPALFESSSTALAALVNVSSILNFEDWELTVNGQTVIPSPDGTFRVSNVSAPDQFGPGGPGTSPDFVGDDFVRLIGHSSGANLNRYVFSEFFQIRQGQTYVITNLTFTDLPPRKPESLTIMPETRVMTVLGQTNRLRVIARFADGGTNDVAPKASWTTYRVSNPNIATVTPDGGVIGRARGVVFVTAVNEGASAVAQLAISPDDTLTTVVGVLRDTNGVPVAGATVTAGALGMSAVTDADGRFAIVGVPAGLGQLTVTAVLLRATNLPLVAISGLLTPVPGGQTDAGVVVARPGFPGMASIPPGTFVMGSPASERLRGSDETQHTVTLTNGFWLGRNEVTQGEYLDVIGSNPSYFRNGVSYPGGFGGVVTNELRHPVEQVSWIEATNYCARLTQRERQAGRIPADYGYRLPTEAEWEYACRGGTTNAFHYGKALRGGMANFNAINEYDADVGTIFVSNATNYLGRTSVVGSYVPNAFGLSDMHGNVWEWCSDWYGAYPAGSVTNPAGPASGFYRVVRGGSWIGNGRFCRSASRDYSTPGFRSSIIGFRVVLAPGR